MNMAFGIIEIQQAATARHNVHPEFDFEGDQGDCTGRQALKVFPGQFIDDLGQVGVVSH